MSNRRENFVRALSREHFMEFGLHRLNILLIRLEEKERTSNNKILGVMKHRVQACLFEKRLERIVAVRELNNLLKGE